MSSPPPSQGTGGRTNGGLTAFAWRFRILTTQGRAGLSALAVPQLLQLAHVEGIVYPEGIVEEDGLLDLLQEHQDAAELARGRAEGGAEADPVVFLSDSDDEAEYEWSDSD